MIDIEELRQALRTMKPRTKLYEVVKDELNKQGRWKNKSRGKEMQRGYDERRDK